MSRLLHMLSFFLLFPLNAMAVDINEQDAQKLKTSFQNILDYQKTVNETFGTVQVVYEGDLSVSKEADYYKVTLPKIILKSPETEDPTENFVFDIGIITINAMPDDKEGYWKTTVAFPEVMTASDSTKDLELTINIGNQNTIAILNDRLGYFTKMNLNFSEMNFTLGQEDLGFKLGGIQFYTNSEESDDGKFSGPGHLLLSNLIITPPGNDGSAKVGEIKLDFSIKDFKLPTLQEYQAKMLKHSETFKSLATLEEDSDIESVNSENVAKMISDLYNFDMDGFGLQYSIKDLEITSSPDGEVKDFDTLTLGSAFLGFGFDGLSAEKGMLNIKTGYDTISISPKNPEYEDVLPQHANFDIKAENIPYGTITEVAQNSVDALIANPDTAQMVGLGLLMRLPAILSQSGTQIIVENNGIKNDIYSLTLDGKVMTDLAAIMGFSSKFKAVFEGLDSLLSIAKKYAENEDSVNAMTFSGLADTLETLKSVGEQEAGPNGKPAYGFNFETTPQGEFLVNGQDPTTVFAEEDDEQGSKP